MEDHLCDVVLKSHDGTEHPAHTLLLSATSLYFKNLLSGSFLEADRVQRKEPVEIAASKEAVSALLDYIYGGQPEVPLQIALELLQLAEACDLPKLARKLENAIAASINESSNSSAALKVLQEAHGLHALKAACEDKVAQDFETCSQHSDFQKLSASQLARILKRDDLNVIREESVLKCIFSWLKSCEKKNDCLGMLLQHIDFQSFSVENLLRIGRFTSGPQFADLHREVDEAMRLRGKRAHSSDGFEPKRKCLRHWSSDLGASIGACLPKNWWNLACGSLCCHDGAIYVTDYNDGGIQRLNPGGISLQVIVPKNAEVIGTQKLGPDCRFSISPTGEIFVLDFKNHRLVKFQNGSGNLVCDCSDASALFCSPNGILYVLQNQKVQKLNGSTLQTVVSVPKDLNFWATWMFVTKEEVIYLSSHRDTRILRVNPGESSEAVVVAKFGIKSKPELWDLCVTEDGTIYVADRSERKVLAFRPEHATCTEVLQCPSTHRPVAILVQDRSLYVGMVGSNYAGPAAAGVFEYVLPTELQLEWKESSRFNTREWSFFRCFHVIQVAGCKCWSCFCKKGWMW